MALVKMVRSQPIYPGGPVTADVHPDEVAGMEAYGWRIEIKGRGRPRKTAKPPDKDAKS